MRKVIAGLFISLDGVVESPDKWQFDHFDREMMEGLGKHMAEEDTVLLGRKIYEEWAGYWPISKDDLYAPHINSVPKFVVSRTLKNVRWGDFKSINLIKDNHTQQIKELKQQSGKNIGVAGPTLVRSLLQEGILDELMLMVHPVVVGKGKKLFPDGEPLRRLNLVRSNITSTGVAILTYQPRA